MARWVRSSCLAVFASLAVACLPPRPPNATQASKVRSYSAGPRCRSVLTVADPDIRLKWEWGEGRPSEIGGHDRERLVCRW